MTMKKNIDRKTIESRFVSRRQFLLGVGGATLALPMLASLFPREVEAATLGAKRLICFPTLYGIAPTMFFPPVPAASAQTQISTPDLPIWSAPLTGAGFTLPFTNDSSKIGLIGTAFQPVLSKMNLYQGLDYPGGGGHTYGALGANPGNSGTSFSASTGYRSPGFGQSIDNVVAKSGSFYKSTPPMPVLRMATTANCVNWSYSRTSANTSPADPKYENFYLGDTQLFNLLFSNLPTSGSPPPPVDNRVTIGNAFLQDYKTLLNNPRISSTDKQILNQYIDGINSLEAGLSGGGSTSASCSSTSLATLKTQLQTKANNQDYWGFPGIDSSNNTTGITSCLKLLQNYNAIIQNAFLCDQTRVVVFANEIWQDGVLPSGTLQAEMHCHIATQDGPMHAWFLNNVVAALAVQLQNTPDPLNPGTSLLDNTIILFTNEHSGGNNEHVGQQLPVMTIGNAGGALKTGYYFDCRQRPYTGNQYNFDMGRPYAQLLIAVMQALGLSSSEILSVGGYNNPNGFGDWSTQGTYTANDYATFSSTHNSPLPWILT